MSNQELRLKLFGGLDIRVEGQPVEGLLTKAEALLVYLAVTGQEQTRQWLATLLWGDKSDTDALRNLRVNLNKLRPLYPHLIIDRQSLTFNHESRYWLDVEAFEDYLQRSRLPNGRYIDYTLLREAINLYDGEFLAQFDVGDAPEFEEWLLAERSRLQPMLVQALDALVEHCIDQETYAEGIAYAYQLLEIEAWREETHQQLMWLLALDGQVTAALAQYDKCCEMLWQVFNAEPTAETVQLRADILALRDKPDPRPTRPLPPLPDPADDRLPFMAPRQIEHFLGREAEIDGLWQGMRAGDNGRRRFAISGMGGVGKTALAIQLAHRLRGEFPDGVLWANAAISDPMRIAEQWAAPYGYDFSAVPDLESRAASLRQVLAEKKALLVFDDVVEAARVRPLLPTEGGCLVLITTRNAGLAHALEATPLPLYELTAANGLKLLTRIIGQERVEAEAGEATAVCALLQNLPLAITIAGRYLAQRSRRRLADFAARVRDQNQRLQTLALEDLAVRVSFLISWQALDDTQKQIFRWLAVFNGRAFTAEALAAVAELQPYPAQDRLFSLVLLSLLNEEGEHHYRQHPLLADFAHEQLGHDDAPFARMARYFLHYAQQHGTDYAMLRPEWENLSAGIETAYRLQQWPDVIAYSEALRQAWFARGRYTEARTAYGWASEAAMALEDEVSLGDSFLYWGKACLEQTAYDDARELFGKSREIFARLADQAKVSDIYYDLARMALEQAKFGDAEKLLAESQIIREQQGDWLGLGANAYLKARLQFNQGDFAGADEMSSAALALQKGNQDTPRVIRTLRLKTLVMLALKEFARAQSYGKEALQLADEIKDRGEIASSLYVLADTYRALGQLNLAEENARRSLALLQQMGDLRSQALALYQLSWIQEEMKDYPRSLDTAQESLTFFSQIGDARNVAMVKLHLGDVYNHLQAREKARDCWLSALALAKDLALEQLIKPLHKRLDQP